MRVPLMAGRAQIWIGLLLFACGISYPVAYAAERFLHLNFAAVFGVTALTLLLLVVGIITSVRLKDAAVNEMVFNDLDDMNLEDAAKAARVILSDSSKFAVVRRQRNDFPFAADLSEHLRGFFTEIESLKALHGDAELARESIEPSSLNANYLRIGRDIESVEITVRPRDETVYEIDAFDPSKPFDRHRSIYHWILSVDRTLFE